MTIELRDDGTAILTGFPEIAADDAVAPRAVWDDPLLPPVDATGTWSLETLSGWHRVAAVRVVFAEQSPAPLPPSNALLSYDHAAAAFDRTSGDAAAFDLEALTDPGGTKVYIGFGDPDAAARLYLQKQD
jgi:hypothetical protein